MQSKKKFYHPLKRISVPKAGSIASRGLVVVIGPNSSGKTQILKDIYRKVCGMGQRLVVCDDIELEKPPPFKQFLEWQVAEGKIKREYDAERKVHLRQWAPSIGLGSKGWKLDVDQLEKWYNQFVESQGVVPTRPFQYKFLEHVGATMMTSLLLDRRLTTINTVGGFDYETAPAGNELQALYLNESAEEELSSELMRCFRKAVWLDATRGGQLCFRISETGKLPSDRERRSPNAIRGFRILESEGDGLKSYTGICMSLLLGRRPVCLIDEPEMCLHPPQAYALGRFIGRHGTSPTHTTYVATHSSYILRGIIDETRDLQLLRLSRIGTAFRGDLIPYDDLAECLERPSTKVETILDGLFAEAVTVVESEGDRLVYGAVWEKTGTPDRDVHFVSVGGVGGMASTSTLYTKLKIPVVVIADLDVVVQHESMKAILLAVTNGDRAGELLAESDELRAEIRQASSSRSDSEVRHRLAALATEDIDSVSLHRELQGLVQELSLTRVLKRGGLANFANQHNIRDRFEKLLSGCRSEGLFIVPVGELEDWLSEFMKDGPSRYTKAAWAHEAAVRIRKSSGNQKGDIWDFIRAMSEFQQDRQRLIGGYPLRKVGLVRPSVNSPSVL